jgi:hypothetical protein
MIVPTVLGSKPGSILDSEAKFNGGGGFASPHQNRVGLPPGATKQENDK